MSQNSSRAAVDGTGDQCIGANNAAHVDTVPRRDSPLPLQDAGGVAPSSAVGVLTDVQAVVLRIGEMFGEFGIRIAEQDVLGHRCSKWHLRVTPEAQSSPIFDEELPLKSGSSKVLKLKPSTAYLVQVRAFSDTLNSWGAWSPTARTASLAAVVTSIHEIGEDYVRILWDRPVRDTTRVVPEVDQESTQRIGGISNFELRVVREVDMVQEFCDEFPAGVRTYTLHDLRPATAYVVFVRYLTLIGTKKQWTECCRFYTQASHHAKLKRRGEDTFTVEWARAPLAENTVGYLLPDSTIHKFEISIEGEGIVDSTVEVAASTREYTARDLCPGAEYAFRLRCLTKEGRWGARAKPLMVRTADRPELAPAAVGETFLSLSWSRKHFEPVETELECRIATASSSYQRNVALPVGPEEKDKVLHLDGLASGTAFFVSIRTLLDGEWGTWTEPRPFHTVPRASLVFKERGEDFLTVDWNVPLTSLSSLERSVFREQNRMLFLVTRIDADGTRHPILEQEVLRAEHQGGLRIGSLLSDTTYEVRCASWQKNFVTSFEGWGEFSNPMTAQTLQSVALQILDLGEDFAQLSWRRALRADGRAATTPHGSTAMTTQWIDLKYEIIVGCLDTGVDQVIHREVLDSTYTISNLLPDTNYMVSVRACDEREQWGLWCRVVLRTLAAVETSVHEVGEDFIRLMWQRKDRRDTTELDSQLRSNLPEGVQRHAPPRASESYMSQFSVFVFSNDFHASEVPHTDAGYHRGGDSEVCVLERIDAHHSSCRIGNLLPDREYVAVVRALTSSGKWGLWSRPLKFRTVAQFRIPVNYLSIGENYVHIVWNREEHPLTDPDVICGDGTVVAQQLRIHGVDTAYSKDHSLSADIRELKLYGLSPTTAYCIQLRACGKGGEWGLWSAPVYILTRATITTRPVEIAEDYMVISWERKKALNPKNYPTGKGLVTSYHLRVTNVGGICTETFLGDGDCPYRIAGLNPDTYYCVELKANYNDEEWGLWSTPLWCLTMRHLEVKAQLISEEFCNVKILRPPQQKRLPEDDGNRATEDRIIAFGQLRSRCLLCVTTPSAVPTPHSSSGVAQQRQRSSVKNSLPLDCQDHRLVYQAELISEQEELLHTVPNLKANTIYHAAVRSKLDSGEWGMWSAPSLRFATVPTIVVGFAAIGESYITVDWKRGTQNIPPALLSKIQCGLGIVSKSRLKLRDVTGGTASRTFDIDSSLSQHYIDNLSPSATYAVSVQTFNDNFAWGTWSDEAKVRTVSSMQIHVEHVTEDALWVSWNRMPDNEVPITHDTVLNVDTLVRNYEVKIVGDGHFCFSRELDTNKLFFRGLQPDTVYECKVRALNKNDGHWGLWSSQLFRTQPTMRVTFGNIGEHFAVVEWRRHLPQSVSWDPDAPLVEAEDVVQEFRLKVEKVGEEATIYELSPHISSFRLTDLQPSSEYRVWMCAKGHEGVWGLWNQEARVRTLPQLSLAVQDIGEDYVSVSWTRLRWDGVRAPDAPGVKVWEIDGAVSGYHVKVLDVYGNVFAQQQCGYTTTKCTIAHLNLKTVYSIQVCAKDTYHEWGLWSEVRRFITLQPVKMNLLRIGEDHVNLEWGRRGVLQRRFITEYVSDDEAAMSGAEDADSPKLQVTEHNDLSLEGGGGAAAHEEHDDLPVSENALPGDSDDTDSELEALDEDIIRGNETVKQWHLRVHGRRVFGGLPESEDYVEFFTDTATTFYSITNLLPKATYSITVRAQNTAGEWGHWCHAETVTTVPLLCVTMEYLAETFMVVSWSRPVHEHSHLICFPEPTGIHNYQVQIKPLASELPFSPEDEPLVNGSRVYETTQPSLQLSNLLPGTRYRVVVREEMLDPLARDVRPLSPDFGVPSEVVLVETIEPMSVEPVEIGENYCSISWGRKHRAADLDGDAATYTRSKAKVMNYEIQAYRVDDNADQVYKGPLSLEFTKSFPAAVQSFQLSNLVPNGIYAIAARAQTEGGFWGMWSPAGKFITQKRLTVRVELINEDSFVISWARALPDWATGSVVGRPAVATPEPDTASSFVGDDDDAPEENSNTDTSTPPPPANPLLEAVIIGDYSVNLYEVVVEGINNSFQQRIVLPNAKMSSRVSGLQSNTIYSVSVRSMSEKEIWSLFSPKVSLCTLKGMELSVVHFTENVTRVSWHRQPQSIAEHSKYLLKLRDTTIREAEQYERKERYDMEQQRQTEEAVGGSESLATSDHVERLRSLEHHIAFVSELTHCLTPENVHLGRAEVSAYQLQMFGAGGTPFIAGTQHLLQTTLKKGRVGKGGKKTSNPMSRGSALTSGGSAVNPQGLTGSFHLLPGKQLLGVKGHKPSVSIPSNAEGGSSVLSQTGHGDAEESFAPSNAGELPLLDTKMNTRTNSVTILGLRDATVYEFTLRARNLHHEWGPWSEARQISTLRLIQLSLTRFGEHYINLYWHRIPKAVQEERAAQEQRLKEFTEEFKELTPKDLEEMKARLSADEYQAFVARLREWKQTQRAVAKDAANLADGLGPVESAPNTPVRGYHLRVIQENGAIRDSYFADSGGDSGHQFTVTGLLPNTMHVVMLCADYGLGEWGSWSEPIRFMTQNLIQLQITYVGESFVDIEWRRAPNKKLAKADEAMVITNPTTQGRGHQYEVSIRSRNPDTGEEFDDRRSMNDCSVFRIDRLQTDTRYQLAVREWDAKGEWGLWSGARTCCTLAGMDTAVHEIGESWVQLSWSRRAHRKLPMDENAPAVVQIPVEPVAYYLRVEELEDNGYEAASVTGMGHGDGHESSHEHPEEGSVDAHDEDFASLLERGKENEVEQDSAGGPLRAAAPPVECEPSSDPTSRFCLVRKFGFDVTEVKIDDLRPDCFYNVQVLCETTGGQLGRWSDDCVMLSLSKIKLRTDLIDEQSVRLSWVREPPRVHPRLSMPVITGQFHTASYIVEAFGNEKRNKDYVAKFLFTKATQELRLTDLLLSSSYAVQVRATDTQDRTCLWSDVLYFATLKPLRVLAGKILEHHCTVEWGRDVQSPAEYPPTANPILFGQERANQYHLRVYTPHERNVPLLDRQFAGTTTKFHLTNLAPNSCYIVQARSCNLIGEWGLWSEERVVYTMKLVELDVTAVGEDYVKVCWKRDEPDELQEMVQIDRASLPEDVDDDALVDETALKALMMRKRYPLLDKPAGERQLVYASSRTVVSKYTLSITKRGETEDIVMEVPATFGGGRQTSSWTVSHLKPDTQYSIAIRAYYGDDDWGLWSDRVVSGTMNLLVVDVKYIGEDYLSATWQRSAVTYPASKDLRQGKPEETLCYEFVLHDFSEVPIGEEGSVDVESLFVRDVLVAKLKVATVKNLRSNRRYRMAVRRWYHPIEASALLPVMEEDEKPLSEEQRLRALMEINHGTPGSWSDHVFAITLKDIVALCDEIAEDSLLIRWDRDPNAAVLPTRHCLKVTTVTQSYHVRIDAMTSDGTAVDNAPNTLHLDHVFGPEETSYKVPDLQPDSVYKVDVRCCTDKVWGQWSRTLYVVTLPKLRIQAHSIGEDYININWDRRLRPLTLPDGSQAVIGNNHNVEKYHLDMSGVEHHFRLEKKFKASRTSYRVKHLEAQSVFHVAVRSCDARGNWSLWSDLLVFATLRPMRLHLGRAGEQFVHVSWDRPPQTAEEYAHIDPNIQLGRTAVISYHLCVFAMDQAPATAVVDKQFHGDVTKYRVTTLTPNTSYIIIVRACNDESQWGLWSEERVIRTQRILTLQIAGIGENYVMAKWEREEAENSAAADVASDAMLGQPTSFHLAITSETETVDRHFTSEDCTVTKDELRMPVFTTRGLTPDTKYLMALQPCYGNEEWGLWTKPVTFVTLNRISMVATSVTETKVDLAWGRAQQSVELAADPTIVTWRGTIIKYQLLMRKVEEINAAARRERERASQPLVVEGEADPTVEGVAPPSASLVPSGSAEDHALVVPAQKTEQALADGGVVAVVNEDTTAAQGIDTAPQNAKRRQSLIQEPDELRIEREIDVKLVKYVQTSCTIDSLQLNTDYHVQVRALDDANEWGCWTELLFDTPPPPPAAVSVRKSGAQFCIVSWESPDLVARYQYVVEQAVVKEGGGQRRGRTEYSEWKVVDTTEETQSRIRAFGPLNKIRFRVKCCKLDRPTHIFSQYCDVVGLSTSNPPEPVGTLTVVALSRNSATIEWTKPPASQSDPQQPSSLQQSTSDVGRPGTGAAAPGSAALAYRVLLSLRDQPAVLLTTTKNLAFTMGDLEPSTTYKVQVQVESEGGLSQKNVIVKFTTKADSDKTVTRAQAGQPPLGTIFSRPGTQEGSIGQEPVRLPTIAQVVTPEQKKTSPQRTRSGSRKSTAPIAPRPPQEAPPHTTGLAKRATALAAPVPRRASPSSKRVASGSPKKDGAAAAATPQPPPSVKPVAPRPRDQPLPPLRAHQGAPLGSNKGPVEQFDVVGFQHSDDDDAE